MPLSTFSSPVVKRAIDALNQGSLAGFMACFTPNAEIVDVSTYKGHQAISAWAQRENFNVHLQMQVEQEKNAEGTVLYGHVHSHGGYNGPATFTFTLHDGLIQRLVIE
ncbi:MAG TPA: nuclear transport factor 2 family protein [Ktedonobacteraceae bacterium]|nr:nuclear transport factor 2 family protein [Ktedonobacteraceae bacterium]